MAASRDIFSLFNVRRLIAFQNFQKWLQANDVSKMAR